MAKRRGARKGVLDWWQNVMDETKDLVDDSIDRLRDDDDDDDLRKEVADLKRSLVDLSAKHETLAKRRSARKGVLDWWQTVLDETRDLVDDSIDRLRDDDDDDDDLHSD